MAAADTGQAVAYLRGASELLDAEIEFAIAEDCRIKQREDKKN